MAAQHQYLIAIDPGGTTGMAFRFPNGKLSVHSTNTQEGLWGYFLEDIPKPDHVILEEWQYFSGVATPAGVYTASLVSSIKGICYVLNIPCALRTPGSRFSKMDEATEWYKSSFKKKTVSKMDSHPIDALAHLLVWEALRK